MLAHQFEFFLELVLSHIIHFSQLVELAKCETALAQVAFLRLTVVLRQVLIGIGLFVEEFV